MGFALRENFTSGSIPFCQAYRQSLIDVIDVDDLRNLIGDDGRELVERLVWAAEVRGALAELPEAQREALEMSYFDHRTQPEIARQLGVPIGTVKGRIRLGLAKLRVALGDGEQVAL